MTGWVSSSGKLSFSELSPLSLSVGTSQQGMAPHVSEDMPHCPVGLRAVQSSIIGLSLSLFAGIAVTIQETESELQASSVRVGV